MFLPGLTCCFDSVDTQKVYEKFITYFKYNSSLKTTNLVKKMSNCYLFESATVKPVYSGINTGKLEKLLEIVFCNIICIFIIFVDKDLTSWANLLNSVFEFSYLLKQ